MATIVTSFSFAVRETQSLGQQMLNAPFGINGLSISILLRYSFIYLSFFICCFILFLFFYLLLYSLFTYFFTHNLFLFMFNIFVFFFIYIFNIVHLVYLSKSSIYAIQIWNRYLLKFGNYGLFGKVAILAIFIIFFYNFWLNGKFHILTISYLSETALY